MSSVRVNAPVLTVDGSSGSSNVAVTLLEVVTPTAPFAGVVELTSGRRVSTLPARSNTASTQ